MTFDNISPDISRDKVIRVEAKERLICVAYVEVLALGLISLGLSRRKVLDWLAELIFGWLEEGGIVIDELGNELAFTDETIDDVHGKDATLRVISSIIDYGRGKPRRRKPRVSTLSLMQVYDTAFKIAGRPLLREARRAEVTRMRDLIRSSTPIQRVRYVHEVRRLRRTHQGERKVYYSAAVRSLRLRFAAELAASR